MLSVYVTTSVTFVTSLLVGVVLVKKGYGPSVYMPAQIVVGVLVGVLAGLLV